MMVFIWLLGMFYAMGVNLRRMDKIINAGGTPTMKHVIGFVVLVALWPAYLGYKRGD